MKTKSRVILKPSAAQILWHGYENKYTYCFVTPQNIKIANKKDIQKILSLA